MTEIIFHVGADNKERLLLRLLKEILPQGKTALIVAGDDDLAEKVDALLWTMEQQSFVPHCLAEHSLAAETPVRITGENFPDDSESPPPNEVLVNLHSEIPSLFSRYRRLLEIVGEDEADKECGRKRYRHYKERGYEIKLLRHS